MSQPHSSFTLDRYYPECNRWRPKDGTESKSPDGVPRRPEFVWTGNLETDPIDYKRSWTKNPSHTGSSVSHYHELLTKSVNRTHMYVRVCEYVINSNIVGPYCEVKKRFLFFRKH